MEAVVRETLSHYIPVALKKDSPDIQKATDSPFDAFFFFHVLSNTGIIYIIHTYNKDCSVWVVIKSPLGLIEVKVVIFDVYLFDRGFKVRTASAVPCKRKDKDKD